MFQFGPRLAVIIAAFILLPRLAAGGDGIELAQAAASDADDSGNARPKMVNLWRPGDAGQRMNIRGRVTAADGEPLGGARLYLRQADGNGDYIDRYSTMLQTDAQGRYQFGTVLPGQYYGTKHIHITITHDGYRSLDTEILFQGDPNLDDPEAPNAIFLEEATLNNETMLYGRFDVTLFPQ